MLHSLRRQLPPSPFLLQPFSQQGRHLLKQVLTPLLPLFLTESGRSSSIAGCVEALFQLTQVDVCFVKGLGHKNVFPILAARVLLQAYQLLKSMTESFFGTQQPFKSQFAKMRVSCVALLWSVWCITHQIHVQNLGHASHASSFLFGSMSKSNPIAACVLQRTSNPMLSSVILQQPALFPCHCLTYRVGSTKAWHIPVRFCVNYVAHTVHTLCFWHPLENNISCA